MEPKPVPHFNVPVRASVERFPSSEVYRLQSADDSITFTNEDYRRIAQICSEPLIYNMLFKDLFEGRPYSVQDAEEFTKIAQEGWRNSSTFIFFIRNPQNQIVACTDIKTNDIEAGEVGYWCSQESPGIMTNAVVALTDLARNAGYKSLFGLTKAENEKSQNVLTRAGFTKESELEKEGKHYFKFIKTLSPIDLNAEKQTSNGPELLSNVELSDDAILLRPFKLEDAEAHLAGEDDEQVKWLSGGKGTLEGVKAWIEKNQKSWENDGPIFNFAIWDKNTNQLVGMVEANTDYQTIEGIRDGDANISYGLYPQARGRGYATKAVSLMTDFLKTKGIKRAVIRVDPENEASAKIAQRLGYDEAGRITTKNNDILDIYVKELAVN